MKIKLNIIIITISVILIAVTIFVILRKDQKSSATPSQSKAVQLPKTIFDATTTVPGTNFSFSYPSKGFYGLGANLNVSRAEESASNYHARVSVQTTVPYITEKGSEFVVLTVGAGKLPANQKSLEDVINAIDPDSYTGQYAKINGKHQTINGRKFFLSKVTEDATTWGAWTLAGEDIITVMLAYKGGESAESQAAYLNNDQLFLQILENISLK